MNNPRLHVMWICGAASAGKSVAAWELFAEFAAANTRVAYVDIDQLGMLYPEADDDVGWHHAVKGEALAAVLPGYVAAGAATPRRLWRHRPAGGAQAALAAEYRPDSMSAVPGPHRPEAADS